MQDSLVSSPKSTHGQSREDDTANQLLGGMYRGRAAMWGVLILAAMAALGVILAVSINSASPALSDSGKVTGQDNNKFVQIEQKIDVLEAKLDKLGTALNKVIEQNISLSDAVSKLEAKLDGGQLPGPDKCEGHVPTTSRFRNKLHNVKTSIDKCGIVDDTPNDGSE